MIVYKWEVILRMIAVASMKMRTISEFCGFRIGKAVRRIVEDVRSVEIRALFMFITFTCMFACVSCAYVDLWLSIISECNVLQQVAATHNVSFETP